MMYRDLPKIYNYETLEYDRKSRFDDKSLSVEEVLERHAQILHDYAVQHLDGPIPEENKYKEVGSSEFIDDRPELLRLLRAIENPAIKAVLVVDAQRLSRGDLEDNGRLIKLLRYSNTLVITPMRIYNLDDEYDRDAFERELKKGNEYLEYFKKIQAQGKLASVKAGNYVGSVAPYGFDRMPIEDGKKIYYTLVEKKPESDIVRLIFKWYCTDDIGVTAICRRLESMRVKTKSGKYKWKPSIIFGMLENVHYIGCVRWNWRKTLKVIEDQELKILRPKAKVGEYLIYNGKHTGIISEELFNKAAEIRGNRHRTKTNTELRNPLSGLMYCKCGSKMGYNTFRKNGIEYAPSIVKCNNQVYCKTGSAKFEDVLKYIRRTLIECRDDFEVRIKNDQDDSAKLHNNLVENLEKRLSDLEVTEKLQWEAKHHPDPEERMPSEIFKELNGKLRIEKEEIKKALCKARESVPQPVNYSEKLMKFTEALEALDDPLISVKDKNQYLKDIIARIDYDRPPLAHVAKKKVKGLQSNTEQFKIKIELKP